MTTNALGWFLAGISFAAFTFLWFSVSFRELSQKKKILNEIREQVALHKKLLMQSRGGENEPSAQKVLSAKLVAYAQAEKEYNFALKKTINVVPAYLMGFRSTVNTTND